MEGEKTKGGKKENELQTFRAFLFPVFEIPNPARQGGTVINLLHISCTTSQVKWFLCVSWSADGPLDRCDQQNLLKPRK